MIPFLNKKYKSQVFLTFLFIVFTTYSYAQGTTCAGATSVTTNGACTSAAAITDATINGNATVCAGTVVREAWYVFTATGTTATIVATAGNRNVAIELLSTCAGAAIACDNTTNTNGGDTETLNASGLTNGTNYYVRVVNVGANDMNLTSLCITGPIAAPSNDDPTGATPIVTSASCSYTTFTNVGATASTCGTIPAPGCASYSSSEDVWFSVTVPASGAISFDSQTGTMTDGGMAIYSGTACGVLTLLGCDDDNSTNGAMPALSVSGQTPGATLYIRFWDYGGGTGTFGLCATAVTPPSNDNCSGATAFPAVPTNGTCSNLNNQSTANATPSNVTPTGACTSNFGTPTADVWFSFAATGTAMNLSATWVSGNTDVYWQVFSGACSGTMTALLCTDTDAGGTISGLTIGQTYYIKLYPYSGGTTVQNLCLTVIPDPCTTTTNVASCGTSVSTTFGAGTGVYGTSACGFTTGGYEKIFTFTPATTGNYNIQQGSSFAYIDYQYKAVSAGCSSTGWTCIDDITGAGTSTSAMALTAGVQYYLLLDPESTAGGNVTFTIVCPPTPPANDDCTGSYTLTVNSGSTCTTQTGGTLYGATASAQTTTCNATYDDDDVWYSFVATGTTHSISITNVAGNNTDLYHSIYSGSCGSISAPLVCEDNNSSLLTNLTAGTTYFVRIYTYGTTSGANTTFSVCVTTLASPCATPTNIASCGTSVSTTFAAGAGGLFGSSACGFTTSAPEKIFTFTPPTTGVYSINQGSSFGYIDYQFRPVSSGCGTTGWTCIDDISGVGSAGASMTGGVQYYILLDPESTAGGNVTFTIACAPPTPANDDCTGAYSVTPSAGITCSSPVGGTISGATASTQTNSCGGTADDDVWYSFVASSTSHSITITNVAGSTTDLYHSVYAGTCGSVGAPIACSDPNTTGIFGLTIGATYYIRIFSYTGTSGQTTTFSVCVITPPPTGPCGNPTSNDYCSNPASLVPAVGTFSSSTSALYTADQPGNVSSVFCGSIENNSWYYFVATAGSASFPITSVTGCSSSSGIQAHVYSVTQSSIGCCSSFTSVSNCFNPGTNTTGTVTATGLTVGQTYILMVDGNGGNVCNYTIANWSVSGVLPIELMTFVGRNEEDKNKIQWATASEKNTSHFKLEKSKDGLNFESVLDVTAAGESQSPKYYTTFDMTPFEEITYYRLKLFYYNSSYDYSNIISVNNSNLTNYISAARPNPTNGNIEFDVNMKQKGNISIELYNNTGVLINSSQQLLESGYKSLNLDLEKYDSGIYLLKVSFENSGKTEIQKIIKN